MGSPLSSILAELFLNHIENKHLWSVNNKHKNKIVFYYRYVDDTIVLFNGNNRQLTLLKNYLNSLHPNLQFTLEEEKDDSINFLDLTITKHNNKLQFKIYRKPTTTSMTIHSTSHHPHEHKMAAYNSFIHRLLSIPLSESDFTEETAIIKYIAVSNGYNSSIVDKLIFKHRNKQHKIDQNKRDKNKFVSAEYGVTLNNTLRKTMKDNNTTVSFSTSNKLVNILNKRRGDNDVIDKTGIYKLSCDDCPSIYIGQTARSFKTRFKEHMPKMKRLTNQQSAFASHLIDNNHNCTGIDNNLEILHFCGNKGRYMDVLEEFEIYRAVKESPHYVLNDKLSFQSNIIFNTAITVREDTSQPINT